MIPTGATTTTNVTSSHTFQIMRKRPRRRPTLEFMMACTLCTTTGMLIFIDFFHHCPTKSDLQNLHPENRMDEKTVSMKKHRADGSFNNIPITYKTNTLHSTYHCVGENFREDAWFYRSCTFRNLCFDLSNRFFVIFQSPEDQKFERLVRKDNRTFISTSKPSAVAIGGINQKWRRRIRKLQWFPRVEFEQPPTGYYELSPDTTWIPFHSFAGHNVGHLVWDDFYPIFKLMRMFNLPYRNQLLTKIELKLWGSCDWNPKTTSACDANFRKFLPLMGTDHISTVNVTNHDFILRTKDKDLKSNYVCAPHGAAGLGTLTDHGLKSHGWAEEDLNTTFNVGRGDDFLDFQSFMLRNLDIPSPSTLGPPYNIFFSQFSSKTIGRVKAFDKQEDLLKRALNGSHNLSISGGRMSRMSIHAQAEIASKAAIFVTAVGGGAVTASFLPRGASLILFYESIGGVSRGKETGKPAFLDWDVLNHASHLRVHWLPIESLDEKDDLMLFLQLIKHELEIITQL